MGYRTLLGIGTELSPESLQWGAYVCVGGLDILKFDKNSTDLKCFIFQFWGLGVLFGGISPPKTPWRRDCIGNGSI